MGSARGYRLCERIRFVLVVTNIGGGGGGDVKKWKSMQEL